MARMLQNFATLVDLKYQKELSAMGQLLADLCGLLFILTGSLVGVAAGSSLYGSLGSIVGLAAGAMWGFYLAEGFALLIYSQKSKDNETLARGYVSLFAESEKAPVSGSKRNWFSRILGRKSSKSTLPETPGFISLEEIHRRLKTMNSQLWRELRQGVLSGCHAGLYSVHLHEAGENLNWKEVNRKTVAALHRFETATDDDERRASLNEALDGVGQKLLLVQKAAFRKADKLNAEEEQAIQKNEAELWRLSRSARMSPSRN